MKNIKTQKIFLSSKKKKKDKKKEEGELNTEKDSQDGSQLISETSLSPSPLFTHSNIPGASPHIVMVISAVVMAVVMVVVAELGVVMASRRYWL